MTYFLAGLFTIPAAVVTFVAAEDSGSVTSIFDRSLVGVSVLGVLYLFWRVQRTQIRPLERRVSRAERAERICTWRLGQVVERLMVGKPVTMDILSNVPPWLNGDEEATAADHDDDDGGGLLGRFKH